MQCRGLHACKSTMHFTQKIRPPKQSAHQRVGASDLQSPHEAAAPMLPHSSSRISSVKYRSRSLSRHFLRGSSFARNKYPETPNNNTKSKLTSSPLAAQRTWLIYIQKVFMGWIHEWVVSGVELKWHRHIVPRKIFLSMTRSFGRRCRAAKNLVVLDEAPDASKSNRVCRIWISGIGGSLLSSSIGVQSKLGCS